VTIYTVALDGSVITFGAAVKDWCSHSPSPLSVVPKVQSCRPVY